MIDVKEALYLPPGKAVEGGEEEDDHMDGQDAQGEEKTFWLGYIP